MNKKLTIGICISILLVLTIVSAKATTNYETSATGRIVGNSPDDMIRQLRNEKIDLEHATYSEHKTIKNDDIPAVLEEQFNNNVKFVDDNWFDTNDFQEFENDELIVHRTQTYWTTDPSDHYNIKDLENYLPDNYLLLYDTAYAGIFLPKQNLILNKFLSRGGPIIAPTYDRSELFFDVLICSLGEYNTLGETYKESRNAYYRNAGKSELLGLTLMSYNLYGNPLIKLNIPNTAGLNEYCNGITQGYNEQMISSNYNIQQYSTMESDNYYVKSVSHQINEYNINDYEDYSILKISGGHLNLDDYDVVLPKLTKTDEFPQDTIITELTNVEFSDPVDLTIDDLPSWEMDLVDRKCYEDEMDAEVLFSHTYTEDNHEIVVSNIYPVEIVDCETGQLRLYKKINYDIVYYPYSPIIITNVEVDDKAVPNSLVDVKIHIENTKDSPVDGILYISKDDEILSKLDITTTKSMYELKLTTPEEDGVYNYKAEFYYEDDSRTYTTFKLDVRALETDLKVPDIIKESTGTVGLEIENRFEDNIDAEVNYYLMKGDTVVYSDTESVSLSNGLNEIDLALENLDRNDGSYDLIVNIPYLNTNKILTSKVYTNHLPVVIDETIELNEGETIEFEPQVFDSDGDGFDIGISSEFDLDGSYDLSYEDSGEYIIEVTANDGYSESIGEIKLKVNNVNRAPVLEDLEKITVYENELIKLSPVYSDPDNDNSVDNDDNELIVSYSDKFVDGEWTPNFEESGIYTFDVIVSDGELGDSKEIEVEVLNKNRPPSLDEIEEINIKEGEEVNFSNLNALDPDNENNVTNDDNVLVFSMDSDKFVDNVWETNYEDSGSYDIGIEVNDGEFTDTGTVKIIVENTNREPILEPFDDIIVNENELIELSLVYSDPDNDNSVDNDDNELIVSYSDKFVDGEWQTDYFSAGEHIIDVIVNDGELESKQSVKVTVNNVNRDPNIIKFEKDKEIVEEGGEILLSSEAEDPDLEDLTYNWYLDDTLIEGTRTNEFLYKPDYRASGQRTIKLVVEDPCGATDESILDIEITNVKVAPYVEDIQDITVYEGGKVEINVIAEDYDDEVLIYEIDDDRFDKVDNKFVWDPGYRNEGEYEFVVKVSNSGFEVEKLVKVFIIDVNRPSSIIDINPKEVLYVDENEDVILNVDVEDPDDVDPEIIWYINGEEIVKDVEEYKFNANGEIGEFNIKVKVIDGELVMERQFKVVSMDRPKLSSYDGETTKFDNLDINEVDGFKLEKKSIGKIEFLNRMNLEKDVDFDKYSEISENMIGVDVNKLIGVKNNPARIIFYNVNMIDPIIYYNEGFTLNLNEIDKICPPDLCYDLNYEDGIFSFYVAHFTSFYLKDYGGLEFKDIDIKVNGDMENLYDGENVEVEQNDEIIILIDVENSLSTDIENAKLFCKLKGVKEARNEEKFDISAGETKEFKYKFVIPPDLRLGSHELEVDLEGSGKDKNYYSDLDAYLIVKEKNIIFESEENKKDVVGNEDSVTESIVKEYKVYIKRDDEYKLVKVLGLLVLINAILVLVLVIKRSIF